MTKLHIPVWLSVSVVIGALLMATGALIALVRPAMLVSPGAEIGAAGHVYAGYLVSRNLALAFMLLVALKMRADGLLSGLMVLTAFIQIIDAGMDSIEGRWAVVPGVLIYGIVFLLGAARLCGQPFWKAAAWRPEN
jgi:protein-S-isoprenylcysteine O-methyltransferase Ste14